MERLELRSDFWGVSWQGAFLRSRESFSRMIAERLNCLAISGEDIRKLVNVVEWKIAAEEVSDG